MPLGKRQDVRDRVNAAGPGLFGDLMLRIRI
jgi:hypothetical protein